MSYLLTFIITVPLTVFAVLFAVSNKGEVTLSLWPLEQVFVTKANVLGLAMLFGGFLLGALFVSIQAQKTRFEYWREKRKTARLEKEVEQLHQKQTVLPPPE